MRPKNRTIKSKLLLSYLSISIITVTLISITLFGFVYFKKTDVTIDLATKLSKIMGTNLAASLSFDDKQSAKAILNSLAVDKTIKAAFIYDKNGKLFSVYLGHTDLNKASQTLRLLHNRAEYNDFDNIIVSSKISLDHETIGKLILLYNTDEIKDTLKHILLILLIISFVVVLIVYKIASTLQKSLTKPIYTLVDTMQDIIKDNNYTKTIQEKSDDEFQTVFDGFNKMLHTIQKDKTALEILANTDPLTGLSNRRHFYEIIEKYSAMSAREKNISSVLMFDIDHFKNVNDTYGHDIGDEILKDFAKTIVNNIRKGDLFARFGGEEFTLFLPHTNLENTLVLAEKLRYAIESLRSVQNIHFTVSIGVSEFFGKIDTTIKEADTALYRAKESGRNRVECHRSE